MGALENILPEDLKNHAMTVGNNSASTQSELVLPFAEALRAIEIATDHHIVVLGLEAFEVRKDGLLTVGLTDASAYIRFAGDWKAYVAKMNPEAERWIREHPLGEHGYILTSASQSEFARLIRLTSYPAKLYQFAALMWMRRRGVRTTTPPWTLWRSR